MGEGEGKGEGNRDKRRDTENAPLRKWEGKDRESEIDCGCKENHRLIRELLL